MDKKIFKKRYIKPSTEAYNMNASKILCSSETDPYGWAFPGA